MEYLFLSYEVTMKQLNENSSIDQQTKDNLQKVFSSLQDISDRMHSAVKHIEYFMHDIFDYTTLMNESGQFQKIITTYDIRESVEDIMQILMGQIQMKGHQVQTMYEGFSMRKNIDKFQLRSDKRRIEQILLNLLANAVKFTGRNGHIKIIIEYLSKYQNQKDHIKITVIDNGVGIKAKNQSNLFKMFASNSASKKSNTSGIGLGLYVSKLIVEQFNGSINFISQENQGSNFHFNIEIEELLDIHHFSIPSSTNFRHTKVSLIKKQNSLRENPFMNGCKRIMVVDDEEFCISTMQFMLERLMVDTKNTVDFCINGQEAVDKVKEVYSQGQCYQLILTDFSMPILNGIEATRQIRKYLAGKDPQLPIVAVTGHANEKYKNQGYQAGMNMIYEKPFSMEAMKAVLTKYNIEY